QRAVFQQWKIETPWARIGQVTIANGVDLMKEAGILPPDVVLPEAPPTSSVVSVDMPPGALVALEAYATTRLGQDDPLLARPFSGRCLGKDAIEPGANPIGSICYNLVEVSPQRVTAVLLI